MALFVRLSLFVRPISPPPKKKKMKAPSGPLHNPPQFHNITTMSHYPFQHPLQLLLRRLEVSIETAAVLLPRAPDGEVGLPLQPPPLPRAGSGGNQTALSRAGLCGGRAVTEAYVSRLQEDLRVLTNEHIRHLLLAVQERWRPDTEKEQRELQELESLVYGALAKVIADASSAATQYEGVFEAYTGLRRAVDEFLEGMRDILPVFNSECKG